MSFLFASGRECDCGCVHMLAVRSRVCVCAMQACVAELRDNIISVLKFQNELEEGEQKAPRSGGPGGTGERRAASQLLTATTPRIPRHWHHLHHHHGLQQQPRDLPRH